MIQTIIPYDCTEVEIGAQRTIEFDVSNGRLLLYSAADYHEIVIKSLEGSHRPLTIWSDEASLAVLLVWTLDDNVTRIDVESGAVSDVPLQRDPYAPCAREDFVESDLGPLLFYERGVIALNLDGQIRWAALDLAPDDFVESVRDGFVSYIGRDGDRWRYDLRTGSKSAP